MTIKELINWAHPELIQFDSARLDAELLLSYVLDKPVTYLLAHDDQELGFFQQRRYRRMVARRKKGIPVAYLLGHKEFYGLDFQVNKHVLVPRPDTEALVEAVIQYLSEECRVKSEECLLLDVGTGSACIPVSVLKNVKGLKAIATDISGAALKVARANARRHGVVSRIQFFKSDLLKNVPRRLFKSRKVVVSANLPYVPKDFQVNVETKFEPQIALYGGEDGLDIYKRLLEQLLPLEPKAMFLECFDFQKAILAEHAEDYKLKKTKDASGGAGVIILERSK